MNKPSIADLEAALAEGADIEILPNGDVKRKRRKRSPLVPLTKGQTIGDNY